MKINNTEIFKIHAEYCKILSNRIRLMILALLAKKEMSVGEMAEIVDMRIANVSQHLSILRSKNIVRSRKEGQMVYYSLTDERLVEACALIRNILLDNLKSRGMIAEDFEPENVITEK